MLLLDPLPMSSTDTVLLEPFQTYLERNHAASTAAQYHTAVSAGLRKAREQSVTLQEYIDTVPFKSKGRVIAAFKAWDAFLATLQPANATVASDPEFLAKLATVTRFDPKPLPPPTIITPRVVWALWQFALRLIQPRLNERPLYRDQITPKRYWQSLGIEGSAFGVLGALDWKHVTFSADTPPIARVALIYYLHDERMQGWQLDNTLRLMFTTLWDAGGWEGVPPNMPRPLVPISRQSPIAMLPKDIRRHMEASRFLRDSQPPAEDPE